MKKKVMTFFIVNVIFSFLSIHLDRQGRLEAKTAPKEVYKQIYQLMGQGKDTEALQFTDKALKDYGSNEELLKLKYNILVGLKKYDEALVFIDKEIKISGESMELLSAKYNILIWLKRPDEALKVALKKYRAAGSKSPWDCMDIVHAYLKIKDKNNALDWLNEAVSKGFISYRLLDDKKYELLQKDNRFFDIVENIKSSIGLGYPAKNFTVKLLSGKTFSLADQRGKVVMIYFWATWCNPCRQEIPHLDQFFRQFKDKGFEIIGISLDTSLKKLEEYLGQIKLEWNFSCSEKGWSDDTVGRYGVNTVPSLWLVDKRGILRSFDVKGEELSQAIGYLSAE